MNEYSREELLNKLVYTYGYLNTLENLKGQIADIHDRYQMLINKERENNRASDISGFVAGAVGLILLIAAIVLTFMDVHATLFTKIVEFIMYIVGVVVIVCVVGIAIYSVLTIVGYSRIISSRNISRLEKEWEEDTHLSELETAVHNIEIDSQYLELKEVIPSRFCNATDVAGLWELIEDYRADTFKEAANILRDEQHKYRLEERQGQILEAVHKINEQLDEVVRQLKTANVHLASIASNTASIALSTASAARSNSLLVGIALMK
ncbi:hypothetical protein [Streptococcus dentiloxodontae]